MPAARRSREIRDVASVKKLFDDARPALQGAARWLPPRPEGRLPPRRQRPGGGHRVRRSRRRRQGLQGPPRHAEEEAARGPWPKLRLDSCSGRDRKAASAAFFLLAMLLTIPVAGLGELVGQQRSTVYAVRFGPSGYPRCRSSRGLLPPDTSVEPERPATASSPAPLEPVALAYFRGDVVQPFNAGAAIAAANRSVESSSPKLIAPERPVWLHSVSDVCLEDHFIAQDGGLAAPDDGDVRGRWLPDQDAPDLGAA